METPGNRRDGGGDVRAAGGKFRRANGRSAVSAAPLIMGIVNVTPDSFSGDGLAGDGYVSRAVAQAERMAQDGADMLDIGGESSRPGADPVPVAEEIRRVVPVIAAIAAKLSLPIAVDTTKPEVAEAALQAGASIVNDVRALIAAHMSDVAAQHGAKVVLMHNRSKPYGVIRDGRIGGQYDAPVYTDVVQEVADSLAARAECAMKAGVAREKIILDPGIGFGKNVAQNLALIAHLDRIKAFGFPVLMGVSRKSFIGQVLDVPVEDRLEGTTACVAACVLRGADILRVHDVRFMARVAKMAAAIRDA
ncbi:MAG: dihydropteroate synthase [Alphaproteobacteria bacterium]|nr:dihydropteroate synthase [Alphaproteobacteria bacterium]